MIDTDTETAVIVCGDQHINSTVALVKPGVELDEGGTVAPSSVQRDLWRKWLDFIDWVLATTAHADERVLILNGDLLEGDSKGRSNQIHTRNQAGIVRLAYETLEPLLMVCDSAYIVRGTEAHTGGSGELEELLAREITHAVPYSESIKSHWHLRRRFNGCRFDVSHHASMGGLPWTKQNAAIKLANVTRLQYLELGEKPPHVVVRSHVHRYSDSGGNFTDLFACTLPAWSYKTAYTRRIGAENSISEIGGLVFLCRAGQYTLHRKQYRLAVEKNVWTTHQRLPAQT